MKNERNSHTKKFKIWSSTLKGARHQGEVADWPSVAIQLELGLMWQVKIEKFMDAGFVSG
jgi:hypothetical protein